MFTISSMKHLLLSESQGYIAHPRVVDRGSAKLVGDGLMSRVVGVLAEVDATQSVGKMKVA